jgi:hypothetical protein
MTVTAPRSAPVLTERDVLDLLNDRYLRLTPGNGVRYVTAEHVRSHAGFDARRTADMIVQDMWPSSGLALIGHEVKVSRGDWLTELKAPEKAEEFRRYMHRWWLVVSDPRIVRDDLPDGWGLMAVTRGGLRVVKQAPRLTPEPIPRTMQVALLRAATATASRLGCPFH